ncbi:putative mitochondrial soluble n-ethylmaleimide sensitive factor [Leptomonas pyrrhocoris]|uniref:Putative mitochondrial soluble n-ethylmaleimide sensitive factor n=1 Tax=Leptomonas pyrrhocoris TaxID=157538 RepID=A0A0N0DS03_LEPPY|nr:putative mitochondrial soluble n-ethylmaleimide sensitive factor [Leptomonas pyrrhocoris]XP_015653638.1 putative mitochondrial soluble n-ethylmaleimide sensitive factor [Leptomonas pyrrhocoris]KPA75198.1 putative mitochondrial soluble n-ethylmaleimide sensitive factor [Leptomonas pyrrhocoris]KPA75199.1 putative mitochondrial soluble n-ethylmaleimide sensitive factor [Leptomonas pyrrhocoris]|eukprot:XP_015653637.1 putative mitochondrial soluble n-ethylmaleimide sensitive factor [Leptomonas pyrrhocoris]
MSSADAMFSEADKKTKKTFFKDFEGAQDLFLKAAARYKLDKDFMRAGDAYARAGDCSVRMKDNASAGMAFADAANAYKKVDPAKAKSMLDMAVRLQIENNRIGGAARLLLEFAGSLEEQGAPMEALPYYEQAMKYFDAEDQKAQSQKCMLAMAKIYGENDAFDKSLMYYERVANNMLGGPLKFQAQDYFLRAMLCRFAMVTNDNRFEGSEECRDALQQYLAADIYLKNTRESEFLQLVLDAVTDNDVEKFEQAVSLLQDIRKLDDWKTHVLLVVKHNMESLA